MKFTIDKQGKFTIRLAKGNLCGLSDGTAKLTLSYRFLVHGWELSLDSRVFLIDHHAADAAIQKWSKSGYWRGSCEQLARAIAETIQSVRDDMLLSFTVTLTGTSGASITYQGTPRQDYAKNKVARGEMLTTPTGKAGKTKPEPAPKIKSKPAPQSYSC